MNTQVTEDWNDGDFDFQDGDGISSSILNLHPHHQQHPDPDPESESDDQENDDQQCVSSEQDSSDLELELQLNAFDDDQEEDDDTHSNHLKGVKVDERREGGEGGLSSLEIASDWDLGQDDDEDQVDTIKLSSLAGETLESLRLASNLSKSKASTTSTSTSTHPSNLIDQSQFTGTITQLNSRPSRNQRVDMQGGGDWDEDLEIPDFLPSLSSKRTSRDGGPLDDSKDSTRPRSFTSELELEISDQEEEGEGEGSSSKSNRNQNRNSSTSLSEDSNQSLNSLGNIRRNVYGLHQHSNYTSTDWTTDSPSPESNNHRLQGGRINHGGKDFKNRLSSSSISSNNSSKPSHSIPMTPDKSTLTKPPIIMSSSDSSNSKQQQPSLSISMWQKDSEELDLENDFELSPQLSRLDLNPTIIRQKSFNTLDKERVLWNEVSASSGSLSSSPEVGGSLDRRKIKGKSSSKDFSTSASTSEFDEPNEGEDREEEEENEDLLEGLIFPESVFGPADNEDQKAEPVLDRDGDEADGENDNENTNLLMKNKNKRKTKKKPPITNSNHNAREKLQAMLDARSKGIQLAPRLSSDDLKSNLLKRRNLDRRFSDDDDHDFGKGLVITDDLELSPSRLKANGFSFKFKNHNNSSSSSSGTNGRGGTSSRRGGNVTSSSTSKYGSAIGPGRSNFNTGIAIGSQPSISGIGKIARNRNPARAPSSSMTTRNPSNQLRKVTPTPTSTFVPPSSSSSSSTPFNTSSSPIPNQGQSSTSSALPSVRVTNPSSSPNHFSHHQSHLSSDSARSSPPRAPSAYSHLPGLGPRQQQLQRESRALRGEKSVGNLGLLSRTSNHPSPSSSSLQTQNQGPSRQTIDNNAPVVQNTNLSRTRPKPLSRKRSLPTLSVENDDVTPQPSQLVFNNQSSFGVASGSLTTLSKSKSGSTESLNQISTYESIRPKFNEQYPPSRPNTPTGPMRYAVPTASSLARRTAQTSPTNQVPISHNKAIRRTNQSLGSFDSVAAAARGMRRRQKSRHYGDGHELDGFDDLPVNTNDSTGFRSPPIGSALSIGFGDQSGSGSNTPSWRRNASPLTGGNDLNSNFRIGDETIKSRSALMSKNNPFLTTSPPSQPKSRRSKPPSSSSKTKRPTLISSLNRDSSNSKISGIPTGSNDMKWNSTKQKWEGNENDLKIFEQVLNSSSIPALISSSTGLMTKGRSIGIGGGGGGGNGKIVGDMIFDQVKMCWLPKPGGIEEPDVFELMDLDDEDEMESSQHHESSTRSRSNTPGFGSDLIDSEGGVKKTRPRASTGTSSMISQDVKFNDEEDDEEEVDFDFENEEETIQDQLALTTKLTSSQDQGGELGMMIDEELKKQCLEAERRHRLELKGFLTPRLSNSNNTKNHPSKRTSSSRPQPQSSTTLDRTIEDEQRDMDRLLNRRNKDLWFIRKSFGNFKHK